jgi:anti-sigma B factor antagonist
MTSFYIGDDTAVQDAENVALIVAGGELDYEASPQLRARILSAIDSGKRNLVLDLSAVGFIDSTAIGVLAGALARLDQVGGGSLAVVCTHEKVLQIFDITGLDDVIELHDSREQALSALAIAG